MGLIFLFVGFYLTRRILDGGIYRTPILVAHTMVYLEDHHGRVKLGTRPQIQIYWLSIYSSVTNVTTVDE
jgi:hypothetical protein